MTRTEAERIIARLNKECKQTIENSKERVDIVSLVKRILADPVHLIPEMLQNADDAGATRMNIKLSRDGIVFQDNGTGFKEDQVDAICKIAISSKKTLGYIGMYGIGFKSVFAVSDSPEVYSGAFSFRFDTETVFVPEWIPNPDPNFSEWKTSIHLPFKDKKAYESVYKHLSWLKQHKAKVLIYLRNLKSVRIMEKGSEGGDAEVTYTCEYIKNPNVERMDMQSFVIKENGHEAKSVCCYKKTETIPQKLLKHLLEERQLSVKLEDVKRTETDIFLSFETNREGHIIPSNKGILVAFLPTKVKTFLPFDINADFLLNPNREELNRPDDEYNRWIFTKTVDAVKDLIDHYKENATKDFRKDIYNVFPWENPEREDYIEEEICKPIMEYVKGNKFILTSDNKTCWASAEEVRESEKQFRTLFPSPSEFKSTLVGKENLWYLGQV